MGRLTEVSPSGSWSVKGNDGKKLSWGAVTHEVYGALCKLKDYEDTGLSPHDVEEMKETERWIPVEEMLPDHTNFVLAFVMTADDGNKHLRKTWEIASYDPYGGWLLENSPNATNLHITHWRPLTYPEGVDE